MNAFSRNLIASLLGTVWTTLIQLAAVPALIHFLGIESYALIGFYGSLTAILVILDLGLSASLMRTMAGAGPAAGQPARLADALRTYELVFGAAGFILGTCIVLAAPLIATEWLSSGRIGHAEVENSVRLMGLHFALRWPIAPYAAALQGLQRQVGLNIANAAALTVAQGGAVAMLALYAPTIQVFFLWQCACAAVQLLILRSLAWHAIPADTTRGRFTGDTLRAGWKFATGMTGITLTGAILTQADKLILIKLVPLEDFGYYSVALTVAGMLYLIMLPVFNVVFPRLCGHAGASDESGLLRAFASSSALLNALLVPAAIFLMLFSHELLLLWTRDPAIAARSAPLLSLLAAGAMLNGLMNVPFALQLARGNTALGLRINLVLCVLLVPAILLLTNRYGIIGGATVSPLVNGLYLLVGLPLTYKLCMGSGRWMDFYLNFLKQQGLAIIALLAARQMFPSGAAWLVQVLLLVLVLAFAYVASMTASPAAREFLVGIFRSSLDTRRHEN